MFRTKTSKYLWQTGEPVVRCLGLQYNASGELGAESVKQNQIRDPEADTESDNWGSCIY